jgi:hypothetical protein
MPTLTKAEIANTTTIVSKEDSCNFRCDGSERWSRRADDGVWAASVWRLPRGSVHLSLETILSPSHSAIRLGRTP